MNLLFAYLVVFLIGFLMFWLFKTVMSYVYKALPEHIRQYLDDLNYDFHDFTVNSEGKKDRPWIAQHLTDKQWRNHHRSFNHYSRRIGKYANFHGGTIGWLKCEGLPPITAEMKAELEERDRQYEKRLLDEEMFAELAEWQENKRRRQAVVEAIGV
jgi:hypothetical protein